MTEDVRLPALVRRHLERSLAAGSVVPRLVRITQAGEMWRKPGARAMRFTAVEELAVERVAFSWRARFPLGPFVAMKVIDDYSDGDGQLRASALGIRVMRQRGPETIAGEALRYLAELPWIPHAMLANSELEWRELDARNVEVAARVAGERLAVRVEFDAGVRHHHQLVRLAPSPGRQDVHGNAVDRDVRRLRRSRRDPDPEVGGSPLGAV